MGELTNKFKEFLYDLCCNIHSELLVTVNDTTQVAIYYSSYIALQQSSNQLSDLYGLAQVCHYQDTTYILL